MIIGVSAPVRAQFLNIARTGSGALREVARIFHYLDELQNALGRRNCRSDFWNVGGSASGQLESARNLSCGSPIWRLYPRHRHAIALVARLDRGIEVLAVCSRKDLNAVEDDLCAAAKLIA